jgi:DNA repair exonuclease SbcCD ATPase subunit
MNRAENYCDSQKTRDLDKDLSAYNSKLAAVQVEIESLDDDGDENKAAKKFSELRGKCELLQRKVAKHRAALLASEIADAVAHEAKMKLAAAAATKKFIDAREAYRERIKAEHRWPQAGDLILPENWPVSLTKLHRERLEATDAHHKSEHWLFAVDGTKAPMGVRFSIHAPGKTSSEKIG